MSFAISSKTAVPVNHAKPNCASYYLWNMRNESTMHLIRLKCINSSWHLVVGYLVVFSVECAIVFCKWMRRFTAYKHICCVPLVVGATYVSWQTQSYTILSNISSHALQTYKYLLFIHLLVFFFLRLK